MSPLDLFQQATARGLTLTARGDKLRVVPADCVDDAFRDVLLEHKAALLQWLSSPSPPGYGAVPPPHLPLVSTIPNPTTRDLWRVVYYLARQTGDRTGPLTAWLVRRESAYYDSPGRHWDCPLITYAAARDAACWQLARQESEIWSLVAGFEEG